uniref:DUF725 domain-containing protein n=1 Tax=Glossina austeni TaxID=7395 RepID=A0A1A9VTE0_GLOAU
MNTESHGFHTTTVCLRNVRNRLKSLKRLLRHYEIHIKPLTTTKAITLCIYAMALTIKYLMASISEILPCSYCKLQNASSAAFNRTRLNEILCHRLQSWYRINLGIPKMWSQKKAWILVSLLINVSNSNSFNYDNNHIILEAAESIIFIIKMVNQPLLMHLYAFLYKRPDIIAKRMAAAIAADIKEGGPYLNRLTQQNDCLSYVERLENILMQFRKSYAQCLTKANEIRENVDAKMKNFREELINQTVISSYGALDECGEIENHLQSFKCYNRKAKKLAQHMNEISMVALDMFDNGSEQYYRIEYGLYKCTNNTNRHYQRQYWIAYQEMENCIYDKNWKPNDYITFDGPSVTTVPTDPTEVESTTISTPTNMETTVAIDDFKVMGKRDLLRKYYEELYKNSFKSPLYRKLYKLLPEAHNRSEVLCNQAFGSWSL